MSRVVLVTGGSRGIGAATARLLGELGYSVCVNYHRRADAAQGVVAHIVSRGGRAFACKADVTIEQDVLDLFDATLEILGPLTHLVNNAGMLLPQMPLSEMSVERFTRVLTSNVVSCFLCCREAVKRMQSGGSIVNISSLAAKTGSPNEYIDYAASKGAIDSLTRGLALEVATQNIRVNGVRPGFICTDIHADGGEPDRIARLSSQIPLQRGGQPEEVASAIAWLLSDEASYVTGSFVDVAGGR
jgi:NAD(P)-dependent dehydrogenase (short-subunit alcohol dehydrogenase family)